MKTFYIEQNITLLANQYRIYNADATGQRGALVAFAQQKRFAFREKFTLYASEAKEQEVATIQARQVMDLGARYDVRDPEGQALGVLGKDFRSSLLRSTWNIFNPGDETAPRLVIQERNQALAIVRRVWGFLPYLSDIPFFVKYHFDFTDPTTQAVRARFEKTTTLRDHYRLEIDEDLAAGIDWRVLVALGVMLDALQSR